MFDTKKTAQFSAVSACGGHLREQLPLQGTKRLRGASGKDVRQLFERQGALVSRTQRVAVGSVKLDKSLARGQYRQLEESDIEALLAPPAPEPADEE